MNDYETRQFWNNMKENITINIEKLVDKIEINNLSDIDAIKQKVLTDLSHAVNDAVNVVKEKGD